MIKRVLLGTLVLAASVNCGSLTTQGTSASYLVVETLEGARGSRPDDFGGDLHSDVVTLDDEGHGIIWSDIGRVNFRLGLKDAGSPGLPTISSPNNAITVNRYRVRYIRSDGRNTQGVDVPYAFDGAFTGTVQAPLEMTFTLVRSQAKAEPPLASLAANFVIISTIAEVTFYGRDQTGREVSVTANIGVHFANFGDDPA